VSWSVAPPTLDLRSAGMFLPGVPPAVVVPGRKANNADMLTFLLQKELRPSDVGNLGRIILPKVSVQCYNLFEEEVLGRGYSWRHFRHLCRPVLSLEELWRDYFGYESQICRDQFLITM